MSSPFDLVKQLKLDSWYKLVAALGVALILLSITASLRVLSNKNILIFGISLAVYGTGRWKNVKTTTAITGTHKLTRTGRNTDKWGLLMEGLGLLMLFYGIWLVIRSQITI